MYRVVLGLAAGSLSCLAVSPPAAADTFPVPGRVEAEHFVAFAPTTTNKDGFGPYGNLQPCEEGTLNVGWIADGEVLSYDVTVAYGGLFNVTVRAASAGTGTLHLVVDGRAYPAQTVTTGGWQRWQDYVLTGVALAGGTHRVDLTADVGGFNVNFLDFFRPAPPVSEPVRVPGRLEAEAFSSFFGNPAGKGGAGPFSNLESCSEGTLNVGWVADREVFGFVIEPDSPGLHTALVRSASPLNGRFHLVIDDGAVMTATHDVHTGGWQTWSTVEIRDIQLRAGPQTAHLVIDVGGLNFNYIEWIRQADSTSRSTEVYLTTADGPERLAVQPTVSFGPVVSNPFTITVRPEMRYQRVEGFGASMTDAAAWVLARMDPARRRALMRRLFDPVEGIGLNMLRVPMGASDFARNAYTYDDLPPGHTDFALNHFSIAHDEAYIIPMLREARAINPSLAIIATPWTAPAWMKTNQSLVGGGHLIDTSAIYATYAEYFVRFVRAYEDAGIPIFAVTPQNEPMCAAGYPSMQFDWWEEYNFIKYHLGPAFERHGITSRIIVLDHNWSDAWYALALFRNDPDVLRYVAGTAFHCYTGEPGEMAAVHDAFPGEEIYFTECSGIEGFSFEINLRWFVDMLLVKSMRNWAGAVLRWNLVLDEWSGPRLPAGCSSCLGLAEVNGTTGVVTFLDDYHAIAHASRFVARGARRVDSNTFGDESIQGVAFVNPDDARVLIVLNASEAVARVQVREGDHAFSHDLPAGAVATFVWR